VRLPDQAAFEFREKGPDLSTGPLDVDRVETPAGIADGGRLMGRSASRGVARGGGCDYGRRLIAARGAA
jgi:hypothetical protein